MRFLIFLRSFISVMVLFPVWTLVLCSLNIFHNIVWGNRRINDLMIGHWASYACWVFGVKVRAEGLEHIPPGGCLFLFNHRSFFDIFALQSTVPTLRFGAKIELFSIPVFGTSMRKIGALPIARGNLEKVIEVYKKAEPRLRQGERFALSPEGGRNTSSEKLLPFKSGPFVFALSAQAPIVPCVIFGADEVWPKGALIPQTRRWSSTITVRFLPAVDVSSYSIANKGDLQARVFRMMRESLEP